MQSDNLTQRVASALDAALVLAGSVAVTAGAWMIYAPAGYIVGGAIAIALGLKRGD